VAFSKLSADPSSRVYENTGNPAVVALIDNAPRTVLDVGCGAGANAALLLDRAQPPEVYGVTGSEGEALLAKRHLRQCWIADLERGLPDAAREMHFDAILFSHVLEHLRDPAALVAQAAERLNPGGVCAIAVPNVLAWRQRLKFLFGEFEYAESGVMDSTHLRFFTRNTAAPYLLERAPSLRLAEVSVSGAVPLWLLRRHVFPSGVSRRIDDWGCRLRPNLFGNETLVKAIKIG
jgi:2-polyprenyl-3-methyl-5-hydroxy-6-metoxy-1,4-benzoquinol methylase